MKAAGEKRPLPQDISKKMNLWRQGAIWMPKEYIEFHAERAKEELEALKEQFGIRVVETSLISDGWLDGMKVIRAIVETPSRKLLDLKYSDSGQNFMRDTGHGQVMLFDTDLK